MDRGVIFINVPPVFDGSNYLWWKIAMRAFLQSRDFQSWVYVVNGYDAPVVAAGDGTVPKNIAEYNVVEILAAKQNSEGLNVIIHAIAPSLQHHVSNCTRSLPSRYESKKHDIVEGNNLNNLSRNTLVGKLKIFDHEHTSKVGKDVSFKAHKSTKLLAKGKSVHVSEDDQSENDFSDEDLDKSSDKPHGRVPPKNRDADEADDEDMPQCFKCKGFGHFANEFPNHRKYTRNKGLAVTLDEMSETYDSDEDRKLSVGLLGVNIDFDTCSNTYINLNGFGEEGNPINLEDSLTGNHVINVSGSTVYLDACTSQMPEYYPSLTCSFCSMKGHELSRCYKYKHQIRHASKLQRRAYRLARKLKLAQKTSEVCRILSSSKKLVSRYRVIPFEKKVWSNRFDRQKYEDSSLEEKDAQIVVHRNTT
uniref:Zf-CCHC domain-containing protein n=1 Tax=Papaver somniferum TaxID=3469 RepID=A0A5B7LJX5_PAPSO|nr:zf-CCHC domain-containing protein [Papaver somniferum]